MCDAVQQDLCVCRPQPINHCGNKIWKCQTHNSSCKKSQGSASTLLMCRYLCLSSCWKNKARICANNRNEWLSKGKPPRVVFHVDTQWFVFTSPLVSLWSSLFVWRLLSPLCQTNDWKLFEHERFYFGVFLFCPHDPPGGPPWNLSHSYAAHESTQEQNMAEWPTIPLAFPFQQQDCVCPVVTPFEKNLLFPVWKERSPQDVLFSGWSCKYGLLYKRMFCS